ncbi:hypothetical protein DdX_04931 [Ditylenchus destructor]|uniref:Uncharacterized protein n=1 Tax=Ditylenchus destructor TaxID=166010 RepID=A0AAD4RA81_9BILA|nr:hypothetical protein DdX_04931 [Ditylenchus destructor]
MKLKFGAFGLSRIFRMVAFIGTASRIVLCAEITTEIRPHVYANESSTAESSITEVIRRTKRQYGGGGFGFCPPNCFQCNHNQCQMYQPRCMPLIVNCCCPNVQKFDINTACDGEEAVAGCMNGLCGQGYYCTRRQFCCRCSSGKSIGQCINGNCPAGYACNANNYCCAVGAGAVLGKCVNGLCPAGFACGAGDLCYAKSTGIVPATQAPPRSAPMPNVATRNRLKSKSTAGNRRVPNSKSTAPKAGLLRSKNTKGGIRRNPSNLFESKNGALLNAHTNNQRYTYDYTSSKNNVPNRYWNAESGNQDILYDDYDGSNPFMSEELNLINSFNTEQRF